MTCDLEQLYGDIVVHLPVGEDDDPFLFTRETTPQPPVRLSTDRLIVTKGRATVEGDFRLDRLFVLAQPATLRQLGVLTLGVLFHPLPETAELILDHPSSQVKRIRIRFEYPAPEDCQRYWATPTAFAYWADSPFPLIGINDPHARPWFRLTAEDEMGGPYLGDDETWWHARDTVVGFGDDEATLEVARFLLDAAVFDWPRGVYQLEGPVGNDVLNPRTADVHFVLPHSDRWEHFDGAESLTELR